MGTERNEWGTTKLTVSGLWSLLLWGSEERWDECLLSLHLLSLAYSSCFPEGEVGVGGNGQLKEAGTVLCLVGPEGRNRGQSEALEPHPTGRKGLYAQIRKFLVFSVA